MTFLRYMLYISSLVSQAESHLNLNRGCKDTGDSMYSPATSVMSALWVTTKDRQILDGAA